MGELDEAVGGAIEAGRDSRLNSIIAALVAIAATLMALDNIKDGNDPPRRAQAEGYEKAYDDLNMHDDQFDLSDACFSVAIALLGVTALTRKRWLLGVAGALLFVGVLFALAGFFGWSLHPDRLMSWLS